MQPTILSIGSALVDIFITSKAFAFQKDGITIADAIGNGKLSVDSFKLVTGGGASNTSVGFSRLGLDARIIAEMGTDNLANIVLQELVSERVGVKYLIQEKKEETGGSVILVSKDGERAALVHRGAAAMLDPADIAPAAFEKLDWAHVSSLGGQLKTLQTIVGLVQKNNVSMSWNPGSGELQAIANGALSVSEVTAKVMSVNTEEWQLVAKQQQQLVEKIPIIAVTDGKNGGYVLSEGKKLPFKSRATSVVETTGAGDAFVTGLVAALAHKAPLEKAIQLGAANAAGVVKYVGSKQGLLEIG